MKAGYTIDNESYYHQANYILVYNWDTLNMVDNAYYKLDNESEIKERPALDCLVAIFKIKPKCSAKKSS